MRYLEFANAQDTLALWKMISDNTWAAIAQQAEAEAKQKAERAAARKSPSKRGSSKSTAKPVPPKRLPPPLQHVTAPVAKDVKSTASAKPKPPTQQQQQQLQQPSQISPATSSNRAIQPIEPIASVSAMSNPAPVNANEKKPLTQTTAKRNLSNGAGQKSMGVVR
jgi:hypothetical protein